MSHQGRNTRTRWYGKPIIIVFTRQQRAAIKNCLFIQARLFSIRSHTKQRHPCVYVRTRACACAPVPPGAIFRLTKPLFPIFPRCVVFQLARGRATRKKIASHFRHRGGGIKKRRYRGESSARSIARIQRHVRVAILPGNR